MGVSIAAIIVLLRLPGIGYTAAWLHCVIPPFFMLLSAWACLREDAVKQ